MTREGKDALGCIVEVGIWSVGRFPPHVPVAAEALNNGDVVREEQDCQQPQWGEDERRARRKEGEKERVRRSREESGGWGGGGAGEQ